MSSKRFAFALPPLLAVLTATALAQTQPKSFADGDPAAGKVLSDKDCVACHARRYDGDASRIYLRSDRRVKTPEQLLAQIQYCSTELRTQYFPDEEAHVAAYLNVTYYKFAP
jgi:mono/diheme cytochrome c family protein